MNQIARRMAIVSAAVAGLSLAAAHTVHAQEAASITGRVTNQAGAPLDAANVYLDGMQIGGQTNADGRYTILVPGGRARGQQATLAVRLIGFKPASRPVTLAPGAAITHDFTLANSPLRLDEVVVTGAGTTTPAAKLGSARNNVDAATIRRSAETNVVQALAAKAPNVQVTQSSGEPGSSSYIRMRGLRTVNSSAQPLFVIDGMPIDNSSYSTSNFNPTDELGTGEISGTGQMNRAVDINPDDIENVEILKGPAAAAIYGARAAQGVILITTKKGRSGQTRTSLRSQLSFDDINHTYPLQGQFGQGLNGRPPQPGECDDINNTTRCLRNWGPKLTRDDYIQSYVSASCNVACATTKFDERFPDGLHIYNHADEAYDTGITSDNTLSVSGGNDRTTFFLSGSYTDQAGVFKGPNNEFRRSTVRVNASHRLRDNFNVIANAQYADTRGNFVQRGNNANGLQLGLLRTPPEFNNLPYLDPATGLHRSYRYQHPAVGSESDPRGFDNPFFVLNEPAATAKVGRILGNVGAEYQAVGWLKFNYTLGADYSNDQRLEGAPQASSDVSAGGRVTEGTITALQIDHNLTATGSYRLGQNFAGTVTLGQNLNSRSTDQISVVGRTLVAPQPYKLSNTIQRDQPIDNQTDIRLESYFGQATFDLYDQLYLTAALRNDGSSTFDAANRRSWFPKASAAWNFSDHVGRSRLLGSWLSGGKLRAAYGEAGQEPVAYLTSTTFDGSTLVSGIVQGTGFSPTYGGFGGLYTSTTKAAEHLKPERTRETELGFDLGLFRDVADMGFTFYNTITDDVILNLPLAPSSGYFEQAQNAAKFRNRGTELTFNLHPIRGADLSWDVGFQYARNKSRVLELNGADFVNVAGGLDPFNTIIKGEEIGVFRGNGFVRCGISDEEELGITADCAGKPRGALWIDTDGFPVEDETPRVVGNPNPKWTGGVNSSFTYKKLTFSGLLDIRVGGDISNETKGALYSYGTHKDTQNRASCVDGACTGNEKVFGKGGWFDGPVAGPGAGTAVPIGENWYRTGNGNCIFSTAVIEPCMEDGGFVKLRELAVAYNWTGGFVRQTLGLTSVDLRIAGRNLHTWTDYTGYDPETSLGGAVQNQRGQDYFNMPQTRSFVLSVTLNR